MSGLQSSLIFYLRIITCGLTVAFCLHESEDVQHTAYTHTPTYSFEAGKIAVAVYFLAVWSLSASSVCPKKKCCWMQGGQKNKIYIGPFGSSREILDSKLSLGASFWIYRFEKKWSNLWLITILSRSNVLLRIKRQLLNTLFNLCFSSMCHRECLNRVKHATYWASVITLWHSFKKRKHC